MNKYFLKIRQILEKDWLSEIGIFYKNINPVYRHSFWILFIITNIVFGFHTINFLWGNHDWPVMISGMPNNYSLYEGRYGAFIISYLLTGNLYLPIISALWAFMALSLSAIFLAIYWKVPQRTSYFVIFGLILNITPYTLSWLWFAHWMINIFFARLFIFSGFVLSDKIRSLRTRNTKLMAVLAIILLFNFGLSIYTPMINTLIMVIAGRILVEMMNCTTLKNSTITIIKNIPVLFYTVIATLMFKIIFEYLIKSGTIYNKHIYNIETVKISELPNKITYCAKAVWEQFTHFSIPFYPNILTKLFLILASILIFQILISKKSTVTKVMILTILVLTFFCTKISAIISNYDLAIYMARVDFCGYILFNALIALLCFKMDGVLQNIKILICCLIIYLFAINDLYMQRTLKFGWDAEMMMYNRMQYQIEKNAKFNNHNKYISLQIGVPPAYRRIFFNMNKTKYNEETMLHWGFSHKAWPLAPIKFYNFNHNLKEQFRINEYYNPKFMSALKRLYDAGLLENAKAWPAENSIIVYEDIILVITDEGDLQKAKQLLADQAQKEQALKDRIKAKARPTTASELQTEAK